MAYSFFHREDTSFKLHINNLFICRQTKSNRNKKNMQKFISAKNNLFNESLSYCLRNKDRARVRPDSIFKLWGLKDGANLK